MQLDILTPEKKLYSGEVTHVEMPGIDGNFGVLGNHAPMISALKEGTMSVAQNQALSADVVKSENFIEDAASKDFSIEVKGGVVEVYNDKVIVLLD
jgi:F-type H+-transporting ATPase subunit epsilon